MASKKIKKTKVKTQLALTQIASGDCKSVYALDHTGRLWRGVYDSAMSKMNWQCLSNPSL